MIGHEILSIMNACEMFHDPSKSVIQMLQMFPNACECRCESYECVANEMIMQNMGILFAYYTLRVFLFVLYLPGPVQLAYFLKIWTNCPHSPCILRQCQYECKQILTNLHTSSDHYKCLAINKNGFRLLTNVLRICFSYEF